MRLRRDDAFDTEAVRASFRIRSIHLVADHEFQVCAKDPLAEVLALGDDRVAREFFGFDEKIPSLAGTLANLRGHLAKMEDGGKMTGARRASVEDSLTFEAQIIAARDRSDPWRGIARFIDHAVNNEGLDAVAVTLAVARLPNPRTRAFVESVWTPLRSEIEAYMASRPANHVEETEPCAP